MISKREEGSNLQSVGIKKLPLWARPVFVWPKEKLWLIEGYCGYSWEHCKFRGWTMAWAGPLSLLVGALLSQWSEVLEKEPDLHFKVATNAPLTSFSLTKVYRFWNSSPDNYLLPDPRPSVDIHFPSILRPNHQKPDASLVVWAFSR